MSLLETRYRRVLRLLPASYRADREEEMVCAFLEGSGELTDADNPRPRWTETASIAALAIRVRLGAPGATPHHLAWGETIRLTAILGLFFHATMSATWLTDMVIRYQDTGYQAIIGEAGSAHRLQNIVSALTFLLWITAYTALVRGLPRVAKPAALLALALFYSRLFQDQGPAGWVNGAGVAVHGLLYAVPVLALLTGFHRDAPPPRRPWRMPGLAIGAGIVLYLALLTLGSMAMTPDVDWRLWSLILPWVSEQGLTCLAFLSASLTCFRLHLRDSGRRSPALPLALTVLAVPVITAQAFAAGDPITPTMAAMTFGQLTALLLCGAVLATL